ncbi:MAG: protein phosphatase 2C domain-containing protein [Tannerella sp.]|jgi:protein phosphatase|nr:protein phosphatase 2C domain-containing protein [Tannerella sp.]
MSNIHFQLTAGTDVGRQRSNNEDNFIVNANLAESEWFIPKDEVSSIVLKEKGCLLVVADGMGGMNAGEVASGIAVDSIQKSFLSYNIKDDIISSAASIENFMKTAVLSADNAIKEHAEKNTDTFGMGTTVIMAWILGGKVYISWCGDSRAYSFHPESGLIQLSKDHSYVQELVDEGRLDKECAFDHPNNNIITRSLGDPGRVAKPDFVEHDLRDGEMILLCTDGLSGMMRDPAIEKIMAETADDITVCKNTLIESALKEGGHDNVTIALCKILSGVEGAEGANDANADDANAADDVDKGVVSSNTIKPIKKSRFVALIVILLLLLIGLIAFGIYYMRYIYNPEM